MPKYTLFLVIVLSITLNVFASKDDSSSSLATELYRAGRMAEARFAYENQLLQAEVSSDTKRLWRALMEIAWFHGEISDYRQAIAYANRSLETASSLQNPFYIGRSLCWLGMNYASVGLYELALEFYNKALKIGAPDGVITIIPVWGLAQQEIGAIHFRMGNIPEARRYLEETYQFAKKHQIPPGISEGGAHLAEIALIEGELAKAVRLAEDAVATAEQCGCSPQNLARARVMLAKAAACFAETDPEKRTHTEMLIDKCIETALTTGNARWLAEGKLLLSQFLPNDQFERRRNLIEEALALLVDSDSEIRGTAEAQLGRLFLENEQLNLAKFYLENGHAVNQELFRRVDNAYILADISDLLAKSGKPDQSWKKLADSTAQALAISNLPLALTNQETMALELEAAGYYSLAFRWAKTAVDTLEKLSQRQISEDAKADLRTRELLLHERLIRLAARFSGD